MNEKMFMQMVVDLATYNGWRHYHTYRSTRSPAGFPDLVLVRPAPGDLLFIECKTDRGRMTPDQDAWMHDLQAADADARLWRPRDFDEIEARLARRRP